MEQWEERGKGLFPAVFLSLSEARCLLDINLQSYPPDLKAWLKR